MAIPTDTLNHNFVVVDERATIAEVRDRVKETKNNWTYIVVGLASGDYAVLRLTDIIRLILKHCPSCGKTYSDQSLSHCLDDGTQMVSDVRASDLLNMPLVDAPGLLVGHAAKPVEQNSVSRSEAQRLANAAPGKRLAVMADGKVAGVLAIESRTREPGLDLSLLDSLASTAQFAPAKAPMPAALPMPAPVQKHGLTEDELAQFHTGLPEPLPIKPPLELKQKPSTLAATENDQESEKRWINAEVKDHKPTERLEIGRVYTLTFDVDTEVRESSLVKGARLGYRFQNQEQSVELTIQLSSDDFEIHSELQKLIVPRVGKSENKASFDIEPKHAGEGIINAVFLKEGNFIQLLTLRLNAGSSQALLSESMSRPLDAAFSVQPRDLSLVIMNMGNGFKVILTGAVTAEATLPITLAELDQMIAQARKALQEIVNLEVGPDRNNPYQSAIQISREINQVALKHLAEAGYLLFQQMFYGGAADAQANLLGDKLREMAQKHRLKIQIVSQQFLLPWGLLYLATDFDPENIDPELFLGLKHIIEHIPLQPNMQVVDSTINSRPNLTVSINVNRDIDQQMGAPLIADQLNYWGRISHQGSARVIVRESPEEVEQSLTDCSGEQVFYFYCHAASTGLSEAGGPDASSLNLGGKKSLTLRDLKLRAPVKKVLPGSPLVFINACESAELSPLFYGGFVPYFMAKGARGVIGTECETPAIFAREWARRFFDNFLAGEPLGKLFLDLRREFYYQHNNVMGLLYAIYCDGDTQIVPGVSASQS